MAAFEFMPTQGVDECSARGCLSAVEWEACMCCISPPALTTSFPQPGCGHLIVHFLNVLFLGSIVDGQGTMISSDLKKPLKELGSERHCHTGCHIVLVHRAQKRRESCCLADANLNSQHKTRVMNPIVMCCCLALHLTAVKKIRKTVSLFPTPTHHTYPKNVYLSQKDEYQTIQCQ
jgi:hypothetical protein